MKGLKKFAERVPEWCENTPANRSRLKRERQETQIRRLTNTQLKNLLSEKGERTTGNKPELQQRLIDSLPIAADEIDEQSIPDNRAFLLNGLVARRHSQIGPGIRYSASQLELMWVGQPQTTTGVHVVQPATKAGGSCLKNNVKNVSHLAKQGIMMSDV